MLTELISTVSYFKLLPNFDVDAIGRFSASGTKLEIRKLITSFSTRCQWTYGNLPTRSTDVIM